MNQNNSIFDSANLTYKNFNCSEMGGFSFEFPDFKNWELQGIQNQRENLCVMYFNWPDDIEYEIPPQIRVEKIKTEAGDNAENKKQNPQNISYEYVTDLSLYVEGHKFEEGDWDWLVFYGKDFYVKISKNGFGKLPFDTDLFYGKIIETFNFR